MDHLHCLAMWLSKVTPDNFKCSNCLHGSFFLLSLCTDFNWCFVRGKKLIPFSQERSDRGETEFSRLNCQLKRFSSSFFFQQPAAVKVGKWTQSFCVLLEKSGYFGVSYDSSHSFHWSKWDEKSSPVCVAFFAHMGARKKESLDSEWEGIHNAQQVTNWNLEDGAKYTVFPSKLELSLAL